MPPLRPAQCQSGFAWVKTTKLLTRSRQLARSPAIRPEAVGWLFAPWRGARERILM